MSDAAIIIPKAEYDRLKVKADLFDRYIETEELTKSELARIKAALRGPLMTKKEFMKRHPGLA